MQILEFDVIVDAGPLKADDLRSIDIEIRGVGEVLSRSDVFSDEDVVWSVRIEADDLWDAGTTYRELREVLDTIVPGTVRMPERPRIREAR